MPDTDFSLPSLSAADALARVANGTLHLVDLRKPAARAQSGRALPGAVLRDPFTFGHDDPLTADPRPLGVFCVHGHEVSRFGCALLMLHGRDVHYITGGFEALVAAGAGTVALEDGA